MKKLLEKRNVNIILATILTTIFCVAVTFFAALNKWPNFVYYVFWIQMVIIIYTCFDYRIPTKIQSIIFSTFCASTVFICCMYLNNFYLGIIFCCGILVLSSFYQSVFTELYELILVSISGFVLIFILKEVSISNVTECLSVFSAYFVAIGISVSLIYLIHRDYKYKERLQEAVYKAEKAEHAKSDFLANMSH